MLEVLELDVRAEAGADLQRAPRAGRAAQRVAMVEALDEAAAARQILEPASHERVANALLVLGERR